MAIIDYDKIPSICRYEFVEYIKHYINLGTKSRLVEIILKSNRLDLYIEYIKYTNGNILDVIIRYALNKDNDSIDYILSNLTDYQFTDSNIEFYSRVYEGYLSQFENFNTKPYCFYDYLLLFYGVIYRYKKLNREKNIYYNKRKKLKSVKYISKYPDKIDGFINYISDYLIKIESETADLKVLIYRIKPFLISRKRKLREMISEL